MAQLLMRRGAIRFRRGSLSRVAGPRKVDKLTLYITGPVTGGYPVRSEVQIPLCRVALCYHMWLVARSLSSVALSSGVQRTRPANVFTVSVVLSEHKDHAQEDGNTCRYVSFSVVLTICELYSLRSFMGSCLKVALVSRDYMWLRDHNSSDDQSVLGHITSSSRTGC